MAPSPFSLILRLLSRADTPHNRHHHHRLLRSPFVKHFSVSSSNHSDPPNPPSLSARLNFVFDQIDQIEKERSEKDGALQRIRAWRESRKPKQLDTDVSTDGNNLEPQELGLVATAPAAHDQARGLEGEVLAKKEVKLMHPWPEWIEFMERLVKQNYFDHRRKDEDKMIEGLGFDTADTVEVSPDFVRDWKSVHTAVLNFGKDRFDIFRSFARHDIQMLVGHGCPSSDRKVVFSSKLLRKYVHLDEGDVCSSCSLRTSCDKAYLLTHKEDEARTIDIVRVLLTYGFEYIDGSVVNKSLLKKKSTKTSIRKLLHEVVKLSSVPIDPNLSPPIIKKRPPKVKQPPPPPRRRIGRDDIEMKKGDWLCPKCDFMNFAKNSICLQCDAKRPKRQLLPGEWECPQCNFLNYRRNMACFHCEHKRPADEFTENEFQDTRRGPSARPEVVVDRKEVYNAWNFDFDDDESDGADVAAFEHADARGSHEDRRSDIKPERALHRDDSYLNDRNPRTQYQGQQSKGTGFDDFEDEEDDNIDNYEIEDTTSRGGQREETSSVNFSDIEGYSVSEDEDDTELLKNHRTSSRSRNKSPSHGRGALNGSDDDIGFGSDDDLPVHPKWKSSHVADSRQQRAKAPRSRSRERGFDSDEEDVDLPSGIDDDDRGLRSKTGRGNTRVSDRRDNRGYGGDDFRGQRDEYDRGSAGGGRRGGGRGGFVSRGGGRGSFGGPQRPLRESYDNGRGGGRGSFGGKQRQSRESFDSGGGRGGRGGFGRQLRDSDKGRHFEEDRPRRPPRVNVR
ncbi:hypothetical protein V2J09_019633 [Rumex salicifolius]